MKIFLLIATGLILAACGFEPMYARGTVGAQNLAAAQGLDQIEIDIIPNAEGVALRNILIDRFYAGGYPQNPGYRLSVAPLNETITDADITVESETTSRRVLLRSRFGLMDMQTGEVVLERNISAHTSYNVIGSQFTTRVSEADARKAAIADLARQIEMQIALYFNR